MKSGPVRKLSDERSLAEAIIGYLKDNPNAMDSLEGIAEFWVVRNTVQAEVAVLGRVLRQLVENGTLEQVGTGPNCLYRLTRANDNVEAEKAKH